MSRWLRRLMFFSCAFAVLACILTLLTCWHHNVWSWRDWEIYEQMSLECHPVWRDLNAGRIKPGDDIQRVIWRTKPSRVENLEDVTMLSYPEAGFTIVGITAKDGRVVSAGAASCTWNKTFFDTWDKTDQDEFQKRYSAHLNARWRLQNPQ